MARFLNKKIIYTFIFSVSACYALLINYSFALSSYFPSKTPYQVCFTPGQNCTQIIIDAINHAQQSIYVQAYSFTSAPISSALLDAKRRGLDVKVILDKSQIKNNRYSSAKYLMNNGIQTWIDYRPAIAHSKVIIVDKDTLITGSFNFTKAAQTRNAENLIVINDAELTKKYFNNWLDRKNKAILAEKYNRS
jgi:phosphatidylserine/phosphatidylglycerophosphate/cardiolipin synthase-like enzyme